MESSPHDLDRVRVQTARMLEIYSLVAGELESRDGVSLSPENRTRFRRAIETIAGNMTELQSRLACEKEDTSPARDKKSAAQTPAPEALAHLAAPISLDDLISAVLRWSVDSKAGK